MDSVTMTREEISAHAEHYQSKAGDSWMVSAKTTTPFLENEVYAQGVADGIMAVLGAIRVFHNQAGGIIMVGGATAAMLAVACDNLLALQESRV